jgi:hypothetical protein
MTSQRVLFGITAVVAAFAVALIAATLNTKRNAEALLSELEHVQVGQAGSEEVQAIATRFSSHVLKGSGSCTPTECNLTLGFENAWLRRLHLAPATTFGAVLLVRSGRVYYLNAAMALYSRSEVISASTTLSEEDYAQPAYSVVTRRGLDNHPWQALVHLTPEATASQHKLAFLFNLACLDKIGGCKDSSDLLPMIWRQGQASGASLNPESLWRIRRHP